MNCYGASASANSIRGHQYAVRNAAPHGCDLVFNIEKSDDWQCGAASIFHALLHQVVMKRKRNSTAERGGLEGKGKRERGAARCREVEEEKRQVCQKEERWRGRRKQKTEYDYMEHEWRKWKWLLETTVQSKSQNKLENREGKIKGKKIEVEGVTHTWKMVFWSPTTSPSPTVRVS